MTLTTPGPWPSAQIARAGFETCRGRLRRGALPGTAVAKFLERAGRSDVPVGVGLDCRARMVTDARPRGSRTMNSNPIRAKSHQRRADHH